MNTRHVVGHGFTQDSCSFNELCGIHGDLLTEAENLNLRIRPLLLLDQSKT